VRQTRIQTWVAVVVVGVGLLLSAILGLFAYMSATASPLHLSPQDVPSLTRSAPLPEWADAVKDARQIVRTAVTAQNLPGVSVAVAIGGDIVWAEGFGWADLESQTPVTPDTRFRIGETSKALTSTAVGLLLEKNQLKLDEDIQTYVPEFPRKKWRVTLRQTMAHVAGLRDDPGDEAWLDPCDRTVEGLKLFADDSLLFQPGTNYRASSYSWILVSAAVEAGAPGQTFFAFMRTHIFEPLHMSSTRPDSAREQITDRATFYFPKFGGDPRYGPQSTREGDHSCYAGASAFLSTPADLVRFGMAMIGGRLLQPSTVQLLQTEQQLASGEKTGYGLGWNLETVPLGGTPARLAGHGSKSDFIGGTTYLATFPERGIVAAVSSNISFADAKSVTLRVADTFAAHGMSPARQQSMSRARESAH
jgi:serine beta-lactamase-like protein LACTB, mitochondrial